MRILYLTALLGLSSCLAPPADVDYDATPDAQVTFRIGGTVTGMWDGASVTLRLVASGLGSEVTTTIDANGPFALDTTVVDGTSYTVTIDQQPTEHTCTIAAGEGTIADADIADIAISCAGPAVDVTFSAPLPIDFDSEVLTYDADVSVVVQQTRFTFAAPATADVRFNNVLHDPDDTTAPWALALGANAFTMEVTIDEISRTYTINVDRGTEVLQYLYGKASNPDLQDEFGMSVDVDGDTMVVGAPGEDSGNGNPDDDGASSAGAAYVFRRRGTVWEQEAYLKSSAIDATDAFGSAVAISGNLIAVGAPGEDSNASGINGNDDNDSLGGCGAVYTFIRSGNAWTFDAYLKPSNPTGSLGFGWAVSMDASTLAVGVGHSVLTPAGVYVFTRGSAWSQQQYIPQQNPGDALGFSVSVDGDSLAIGARTQWSCASGINGVESDDQCPSAGAAYVFVRSGTTWTKQAFIKASNVGPSDEFGYSVAIDGDTLAVGAPREDSSSAANPMDNSATDRGATYVFTRSGTTWGQTAFLKSSDISGRFGNDVAIAGELLAVSNQGGSTFGTVTLYRRSPTWNELTVIQPTQLGDAFGSGVALSADTLAIGARLENTVAAGINPDDDEAAPTSNQVGAVYSFR